MAGQGACQTFPAGHAVPTRYLTIRNGLGFVEFFIHDVVVGGQPSQSAYWQARRRQSHITEEGLP